MKTPFENRGPVLVTGPTGNVGLEVTKKLVAAGRSVRGLLRDPGRGASVLTDAGVTESVDLIGYDFLKGPPSLKVFEEVSQLFLLRPPAIADVERHIFPFLYAARRAGVRHVVFLSVMGAQFAPFIPHRRVEKKIEHLAFDFDFIRPGFFMQNLDTAFSEFIREDDEIVAPAGKGKTSFVDARDVGEAGALLLLRPGRGRRTHEVTGPEAMDYYEVAELLGDALGREIRYPRPSPGEFRRRALDRGWDPDYVKVVNRLFLTVRLRLAHRVTDTLPPLLGRAPRRMTDYIDDYQTCWQKR